MMMCGLFIFDVYIIPCSAAAFSWPFHPLISFCIILPTRSSSNGCGLTHFLCFFFLNNFLIPQYIYNQKIVRFALLASTNLQLEPPESRNTALWSEFLLDPFTIRGFFEINKYLSCTKLRTNNIR